MPELSASLLSGLKKTGPTDPIEYYRRPLVGILFRERINLGLRLLPRQRLGRVLEVGYGAGVVLLALSDAADTLSGIDLDADADATTARLSARGLSADLRQGSVLEMPYPDGAFDLVVCFSVMEHLREYRTALREIARVLSPGGRLLLGMPAVDRLMEAAFFAIGFRGIDHHHVTTPAEARGAFRDSGFDIERSATLRLPPVGPLAVTVYHDWLLRKR